jgi:hypothetical protein
VTALAARLSEVASRVTVTWTAVVAAEICAVPA